MLQTKRFMTIQRHILEGEKMHPEATGELSALLADLVLAAKVISLEVNRAGLEDVIGFMGTNNVHGEQVKKLDIFAHDTLIKTMDQSGYLCAMASEEEKDIIHVPPKYKRGKYVMVFDPLDGSSNIDVNISIGTIFSIYRRITGDIDNSASLEDILQPGSQQVAAGYILYGSSTMFVYTAGDGVYGFTLDPTVGEFLLSLDNIKIPKASKIYSINEGNYNYWHPGIKQYINYLKEEDEATRRPYSSRYIGSLVADIHRNLIYGGIFMYPGDKKNPNGKMRLMYECNPMAFIAEQAGGLASNGKERIMDIKPGSIHQKSQLFIGNQEDVRMLEKFLISEEERVEMYSI